MFVDVLYCCHGYVVPRGPSGLWEDGFYFEVFPPIVHYHRELLLREAEVSKNGSKVFGSARKKTASKETMDISICAVIYVNHN